MTSPAHTAAAMPGGPWQSHAACTDSDQRLFHRPNPVAAKAICGRCPVRAECLYDALKHDAPTGVWGGLTRNERRALPALPPGKAEAIVALRELLAATDEEGEPSPPTEARRPARSKAAPSTPSPDTAARQAETTTAAPREDVAALLREGATQRQIMEQLGVSARMVATTRRAFDIPLPQGPGFRYSPEQRAENERRTLDLLRAGATYAEVSEQVGISAPTIVAIRRKAGLPPPVRCGGQARTKTEALAASIEPYGDGHARWTGPTAGRMAELWANGTRFNGRHVVFERHHGRLPVGNVRSNCGETACMTGAHLIDGVIRRAQPEEPVTVQALKDLLDEIDQQGGPQAARNNRLQLPEEEPDTMTTTAEPATTPAPAIRSAVALAPAPAAAAADTGKRPSENLPVGQLLRWADEHQDTDVQDAAARTRAALVGLRNRYDADHELAAITSEKNQLETRLAELQARQEELAPPKSKARRSSPGYDGRAVRTWARENNIPCPDRGRVPKAVLDAWREATGTPDDPS